MIQFASDRIRSEWKSPSLTSIVKQITKEAAHYARSKWNWDFYLTSIHRSPEEDTALGGSGIHVAWRAVDVRSSTTTEAIKDVMDHINARWQYDPKRPTIKICVSATQGTSPDMHFQAHPNTVVMKKPDIKPKLPAGFGIDISSNNGDIDWSKIKNDNRINYVIIRLSMGAGTLDQKAYPYAANAKAAGKKISYYHFAYPDPRADGEPDILLDARNEAHYFKSLIEDLTSKNLKPDFSLAIDLEDDPHYQSTRKLSPTEYYNWLKAFFSYFPGPVYQRIMIYGSPAYLDARLPPDHQLGTNPLWIANYKVAKPHLPRGWSDYALWQYDEKGSVAGITGDCDMDSSA